MIIDSLIELAQEKTTDKIIKDLRLGLGYTAVLLSDDKCGLAYTFRNELGPCCSVFDQAGSIKGRDCKEVIQWAKSDNLVQATMGLATINALLQEEDKDYKDGNLFDVIDIRDTDTLGVIGDFGPLTRGKGKNAKKMYIFERKEGKNYYPYESIDQHLSKCDIIVITSTSIINKTFDSIIRYCKQARQVIMVGPTTPLCPDMFKDYGVNILAGVFVKKPLKVLNVVSQGGGTKNFGNSVQQIYFTL